jgi:hypothetical protein
MLKSNLIEDIRFNSTYDGETSEETERAVSGSTPMSRSSLIPSAYDNQYADGSVELNIPGTSLGVSPQYAGSGTILRQYQLLATTSWVRGAHAVKFGADWRRISAFDSSLAYSSSLYVQSVSAMQNGIATSLQVSAINPGEPIFDNLSLFVQDHFRVSHSTSMDYGLRWEFNPPPGPSNGAYPVTLTSSNLAAAALAPLGTEPYKTYYNHFAPRFGFAWNAIPSRRYALTVRSGFGIFFDTGQQSVGETYAEVYPFKAVGPYQTNVQMPLTTADLRPPSLNVPITAPYPYLLGIQSPDLTMPYTEQWNLSLDEKLASHNTFTASYVGNNGKKLLFSKYYTQVPGNTKFTSLEFENNASNSNYNALQIQDTGSIAPSLDFVGSFTWAHALDNTSTDDAGGYLPVRGNSNYDARRVLNVALNYRIPTSLSNPVVHTLTSGWTLDNRFSAQSGLPITGLYQAIVKLPSGNEEDYYPNLIPGVPIYLHGSAADVGGKPAPENWRLNPAAFSCVPTNGSTPCVGVPTENGNLGRNYVRNPPFWGLNTAVQRSFPLYERLQLLFRADAFNILNHPNPEDPNLTLSSSAFGELALGISNTIGSSNSLYAMGAARSLQISLKLSF